MCLPSTVIDGANFYVDQNIQKETGVKVRSKENTGLSWSDGGYLNRGVHCTDTAPEVKSYFVKYLSQTVQYYLCTLHYLQSLTCFEMGGSSNVSSYKIYLLAM